jgi:hypothetical protein
MMANLACISEPISWLRLERYAIGGGDARIREHVDACPACKHCLDEIQRDVVALPPLQVSGAAPKRKWWHVALPAFGALAAAAIILLLLRPREPARRENVVNIKGPGEVIIDVVRERGGVVRDDVHTFKAGDRFKVIVTCAPSHSVSLDVEVREDGVTQPDRPLAPAQIVCGNGVVMPGAFELTGDKQHRVCAQVTSAEDHGKACLTLSPE